ncbi:RNA-directed DNA polymerase, eukaryota, reverse transcriptase zinc-binding domain protein, partial [Tanacetum coccineum]
MVVTDGAGLMMIPGPLRKVNVLVWRAFLNHLATRSNLIARGMSLPSSMCPFCDSEIEDMEHVLVKCHN